MERNTVYPYGTGGQMPSGIPIVNDLTTGGANKALSAEMGKHLNEMLNNGAYTIRESDYPKTGLIINNGQYKAISNCDSILIPLESGATYTMTFSYGIGGYTLVLDSSEVSGSSPNYVSGYSDQVFTTQGQVVTINGVNGQYLYVRADPVSAGRLFPIIDVQTSEARFIERSEIDEEPTQNSDGVVKSGTLYTMLKAINDTLDDVKDVLPITGQSVILESDNPKCGLYVSAEKKWASANNTNSENIPMQTGITYRIYAQRTIAQYTVTYDASPVSGNSVNLVDSTSYRNEVPLGTYVDIVGVTGQYLNVRADPVSNGRMFPYLLALGDVSYLPVASEEFAQKSISILFIGNSLTQDAVSYVPWLLKNLYPNVSFKFYDWYNGGYTLAQQYTKFTNNQAAEIFSVCENAVGWTNYNNSVTMSSILSSYEFDIVCLQEYFNYKSTYADCTDFNNCVSYIKSNYAKNFKVVTLFHAPLRTSATSVFNMTKSGNELILKTTIAESMLSPGIAVYRALSTDLDQLGDQGHLSPDGTHTQEGLPCLLQAFVVFIWIMRQLAIPISVANCQLRMTATVYSTINVPGPNLGTGVIPGTDAQNILAQDVAILADKEGQGIQANSFINLNS